MLQTFIVETILVFFKSALLLYKTPRPSSFNQTDMVIVLSLFGTAVSVLIMLFEQ